MKLPSVPRISLARLPTSFHKLEKVSRQLGTEIWIKRDDLTGSVLSGNKVRKLEFTIAEALSQGADTLITGGGLQSNHCRATAAAGAQLGLDVSLLLRGPTEDVADGNFLLDQLCGADITTYASRAGHARLPELMELKAEELRKRGKKPFVIPIGASDGIGLWGYLAAAEELKQDFLRHNIDPQWIVCASGSGGTQAGLTLGASVYGLGAGVLGMAVCDDESYFQNKVRSDLRAWQTKYEVDVDIESLEITVNDAYIGPGYAKADDEIFDTIAWLAREEGILLDPVYTGKAFHGLVKEVERGNYGVEAPIVFVHTGGIFGLFPYRDRFTIKATNN